MESRSGTIIPYLDFDRGSFGVSRQTMREQSPILRPLLDEISSRLEPTSISATLPKMPLTQVIVLSSKEDLILEPVTPSPTGSGCSQNRQPRTSRTNRQGSPFRMPPEEPASDSHVRDRDNISAVSSLTTPPTLWKSRHNHNSRKPSRRKPKGSSRAASPPPPSNSRNNPSSPKTRGNFRFPYSLKRYQKIRSELPQNGARFIPINESKYHRSYSPQQYSNPPISAFMDSFRPSKIPSENELDSLNSFQCQQSSPRRSPETSKPKQKSAASVSPCRRDLPIGDHFYKEDSNDIDTLDFHLSEDDGTSSTVLHPPDTKSYASSSIFANLADNSPNNKCITDNKEEESTIWGGIEEKGKQGDVHERSSSFNRGRHTRHAINHVLTEETDQYYGEIALSVVNDLEATETGDEDDEYSASFEYQLCTLFADMFSLCSA